MVILVLNAKLGLLLNLESVFQTVVQAIIKMSLPVPVIHALLTVLPVLLQGALNVIALSTIRMELVYHPVE
jgi:hypothetical protein